MLRKARILFSLFFFVLIVFYLLDFADLLPKQLHKLEEIQLIPALLALNWTVLIALTLLTFLFGRVYCSSICPMGIYQDLVSWIRRKTMPRKNQKRYRYAPALTAVRWLFLAATLVAFLFGFSFLVGLLDPYSAFGRITVHLFKPAYQAGNNLLADLFTHFGNTTFYRVSIYFMSLTSTLIALISLAIIGLLAWKNGRIYCNSVCPVGTFLGILSRHALFQIRFEKENCTLCGSCARNCKASCIDFKHMTVDGSRCITCFNCIEACKESGLQYRLSERVRRLFPFTGKAPAIPTESKTTKQADRAAQHHTAPLSSRRLFLTTFLLTTVVAGRTLAEKVLHLGPKKEVKRLRPIMPPGAGNLEKFSQQCTSCHLCISKCPPQVIKPAFLEYGPAGIMQPVMTFDKHFCNYDCTLCTDLCPTGALTQLTQAEKHQSQIGVVQLYLENCIVYTDETHCGACSEHCPTQAVHMVPYKDGLTIPEIKPEICVGCGGCESICPAIPHKAIFVEGIATHKTITLEQDEVKSYDLDGFGF